MKKLLIPVIGVIAFALGWFLTNQNSNDNHNDIWVPYDNPLFSIQFPPNAHVEQETSQDKGLITHFYNGHVLDAGWANVGVTDYSTPTTKSKAESALTETFSAWFKPGSWSGPITDTTLGSLPAKEQIFRGMPTDSNTPLTLHVRVALSENGLRLWTLTTSFKDSHKLSETDCNKFFDSLEIK
ncbi:MAG TPA: hypothetical protein VFW94_09630 [Candidatus Acidoferrales bacterium]|nr:hypothetical protein [Candidatus Acidoferrales bacterium]